MAYSAPKSRNLVVIGCLAVSVLAVATVAIYSRQVRRAQTELAAQQETAARERQELEAALATARNRPTPGAAPVRTIEVGSQPSAAELLQRLVLLRPGSGPERARTMREVVYYLEALERVGEPAVPVIGEFLRRFEDVAYDPNMAPPEEPEPTLAAPASTPREPPNERDRERAQWEQVGRALSGRVARRPLPRMNYDFPPTLRIGLLDTLQDIRGDSAESVIAEVMQQSGRALEVAYAARALKAMSGDRWRETALATAHELLLNPPETGSTARADRRSEDYLYAVLDLFGDTGFADAAGQRLVRADGSLDRGSFSYLARTLQQNALPTFQAVFNDLRVTNLVDRASLLQHAVPYVGADAYADSMFSSVVTNAALPSQVRGMVLQALIRDPDEGSTTDPGLLQQRYNLLQSLKPQLDPDAYRRVNASLARQLGLEVPAEDQPRSRRRAAAAPPPQSRRP